MAFEFMDMLCGFWITLTEDSTVENMMILLFPVAIISIIIYLLMKLLSYEAEDPAQAIHYFVDGSGNVPFNSDCPICLEEFVEGAETNCGHVYCANCAKELLDRRDWQRLVSCPMCRQDVTIFFRYSKHDRPFENQELFRSMNSYNRFSVQLFPQNVWEAICNMPVLLRHLFRNLMENGIEHDHILFSLLLSGFISVIYFVLPTDIVPEIVFGIYGLIDDAIVIFYCLFQLSVVYRNFLANADEMT